MFINTLLQDESRVMVSALLSMDDLRVTDRKQVIIDEPETNCYNLKYIPSVQTLFVISDTTAILYMIDFKVNNPTLLHYAFPVFPKNP